MKPHKDFSEIFSAWLLATGVKQSHIAKRLGVSSQAVSYHASGAQSPNLKSVEKYAEFFGVSVPEFLSGPDTGERYQYPVSRAAG